MNPNALTDPPRRPLIAPSILSADFTMLGEECDHVLRVGGDLLHLDVMDGHFVPNLTMGPALCGSLHRVMPGVTLDVHLMVDEPGRFVEPFAEAGASHLTFHIEAVPEPRALAERIRARGMSVGLAINPPTDVAAIMPFVALFDLILVMSVNPGFSGQSFIADVLSKTKHVAEHLGEGQRLEMDGGVNARTAGLCRDAGCDVLVAASAIFGSDDYASAVNELRGVG